MIRVVFIGCVDFSAALLGKLVSVPEAEVVGVVSRESSSFNSDFCSLKPQAEAAGIPCFLDSGNHQQQMVDWMKPLSPDFVYCFGWPYLLHADALAIPSEGTIGYHPTALPKNRGRHPIIWTLVLGLTETASTFFFMDEGADSGDILSQEPLSVTKEDSAETLYARLKETAINQIGQFTPRLASGQYSRVPQDSSLSNSWRKRSKEDGKIDWRMPAEGIYNLVRALTNPYPGAHFELHGSDTKVWLCEVLTEHYSKRELDNVEPGQVLASAAGGVDVRCGNGVVRLKKHGLDYLPLVGTYL